MKSIGRIILNFIFKVAQTIFSVLLVVVFSKWFLKRLPKNKRDKPCVILGNGPSLNSQITEIKKLRANAALLCVNDFPFSELYSELKPNYYTLLDPYYWLTTDNDLPVRTVALFNEMSSKTKWPISLLLPVEIKSVVSKLMQTLSKNKNVSIFYFNRTPISGLKKISFWLYDLKLGTPFAQNVLVSSIYLMLSLSHKKIFLFGADHSWHEEIVVTKDNVLCVRQLHFKYDKDPNSINLEEGNFHPVYKYSDSSKKETEVFKIHEIFEAWSKVFKGYWVLKEYAQHHNAKIINLSSKSYIDAFERVENIA